MLDQEFKYYQEHQNELVKLYKDKHIVIVGEEVVGSYDSELSAYLDSKEKYGLGHFLIQLCEPGVESYTQMFHSLAIF